MLRGVSYSKRNLENNALSSLHSNMKESKLQECYDNVVFVRSNNGSAGKKGGGERAEALLRPPLSFLGCSKDI
jgi:hypothetical protein